MKYLFILLIAICFLIPSVSNSGIIERCNKYEHKIRKYHFKYFGLDFPYWYSMAQIESESACRHHGVYSFDGIGSYGLAQITPSFWEKILVQRGLPSLRTVDGNLHAQAFINYDAWKSLPETDKKLWVMYQYYNGGYWIIRELNRAEIRGKPRRWSYARYTCYNCRSLGFSPCRNNFSCKVNYRYSVKLFDKAEKYNKFNNNSVKYKYW